MITKRRNRLGRTTGLAWDDYFGDPYDPDSFGMRIVALREAKGWSRSELAAKAGINYGTLLQHEPSDWFRERGLTRCRFQSPLRDTLLRLTQALDVTVGALTPVNAPPFIERPATVIRRRQRLTSG